MESRDRNELIIDCELLELKKAMTLIREGLAAKKIFELLRGRSNKSIINYLTIECLTSIFSYLPPHEILQLKNVCKNWKIASNLAWKRINKYVVKRDSSAKEPLSIETLTEVLKKCGKYLKTLELVEVCDSRIMPIFRQIHCGNLERLVLIFTKMCSAHFRQCFEHMVNLKFIKMNGNTIFPQDAIFFSLPVTLKEMHIFSSDLRTKAHLESSEALKKFNQLEKLTYQQLLIDSCTLRQLVVSESLTHLTLIMCNLRNKYVILYNLPNLVHLEVDKCYSINRTFLASVIYTSKKITYLKIYKSNAFSPESLKRISQLKYLEYLNIFDAGVIDDSVFIEITKECQNLKTLYFPERSKLTYACYQQLGQLDKLENLYVHGDDDDSFNDDAMECILDKFPNLKKLQIIRSQYIVKFGLRDIGKLKELCELELDHVLHLKDDFLDYILLNCENLTFLNITGCELITDKGLKNLSVVRHLTKLNISKITNLTDEIFENITQLKHLNCDGCHNITDEGIKKLLTNCSDLEFLNADTISISSKTCITAARLTRQRQNDIKLVIVTSSVAIEGFKKSYFYQGDQDKTEFKSPLLELRSSV